MFTRNVCFSRSEWQDPRLMYPFPGAIGRFRIHGARILPPRPSFGVEGPEIIHGAKMLPALPDLSRRRFAGRGPANRLNGLCALLPGPGPLAASRVSAISLAPVAPYARAAPIAAVARAATCARHPRPAPSQTSGTARATQCGHKNGIPEQGSH